MRSCVLRSDDDRMKSKNLYHSSKGNKEGNPLKPTPPLFRFWSNHQLSGTPLILLSIFILVSILSSPFLARGGTIELGEKGKVGSEENGADISEMEGYYVRFVYTLGDYWCHQKESRSLFLNDNQMPVCSRDLGIFFGVLIGAFFGMLYTRRITILSPLVLLFPTGLDGLMQYFTTYESFNLLRISTGILAGFGIASYLNRNIVHVTLLIIMGFKKRE